MESCLPIKRLKDEKKIYYPQTQQNFNTIINKGTKHVAFTDDIIKGLL